MDKEGCFCIGNIVRKYSFKGEVLVKIEPPFSDFITSLESVFIDINRSLVPFLICELRVHKADIIRLKLEGVDDEKEADKLIRSQLYIPNLLIPEDIRNQFISENLLIGYEVIDNFHGSLGNILDVDDSALQTLLIMEDGNVLIPFVDTFIEDINNEEKKIYTNLPEGLVFMNKSSES